MTDRSATHARADGRGCRRRRPPSSRDAQLRAWRSARTRPAAVRRGCWRSSRVLLAVFVVFRVDEGGFLRLAAADVRRLRRPLLAAVPLEGAVLDRAVVGGRVRPARPARRRPVVGDRAGALRHRWRCRSRSAYRLRLVVALGAALIYGARHAGLRHPVRSSGRCSARSSCSGSMIYLYDLRHRARAGRSCRSTCAYFFIAAQLLLPAVSGRRLPDAAPHLLPARHPRHRPAGHRAGWSAARCSCCSIG